MTASPLHPAAPVADRLDAASAKAAAQGLMGSNWARDVLTQVLDEAAAVLSAQGWGAGATTPLVLGFNEHESVLGLMAKPLEDTTSGMLLSLRAVLVAGCDLDDFGWGRLYVEVVRDSSELCGDNDSVGRLASHVLFTAEVKSRMPPEKLPVAWLREQLDGAWRDNVAELRMQGLRFMACLVDERLAP